MRNMILIISSHPEEIEKICKAAMEEMYKGRFELKTVSTGIEGLDIIFSEYPMLLIIDNDLSDIPGMSVASIVKDAVKLRNPTVFFVQFDKALS